MFRRNQCREEREYLRSDKKKFGRGNLANVYEENIVSACQCMDPERLGRHFVCHYLMYNKDDSKKEFLEGFLKNIKSLGLEGVREIYLSMEKQIEDNVKSEKYEMAGALKNAMQYFEENVINRMQIQNFYKTR
jgi:hypothetical protein